MERKDPMHSAVDTAKMLGDAPGLIRRLNKDGSTYLIWRAQKAAVNKGYRPRSVVIDLDIRDVRTHGEIREICAIEQRRMEEWRAAKADKPEFDGSIRSLSHLYQLDPASPYLRAKHNTRRLYDYELRTIEAAYGAVTLSKLKAGDFMRWHAQAIASVDGDGGHRKAAGIIKRLRALISFGVMVELPECARLDTVLAKMRFPMPPRRKSVMTYEQAVAVIAMAHEMGRPSIALAQALQFETGLRQADVIGMYEPCKPNDPSPYRSGDHRWAPGLMWIHIGDDGVLWMETSKTGASVTHDLNAMALVKAELDRVPADQRVGAVIISETSGKPYLPYKFSRVWRTIANAAGVPADVWNRDSRAGALSEGDEAGASLNTLQRMAGHTNQKMTQRYVRGHGVKGSREIAGLRDTKRLQETRK